MAIVRTKLKTKDDPEGAAYTPCANIFATDKRLSWEAKGVMAYLLTKRDDWQINRENLIREGLAGQTVVRRILKELTRCGYLVQELVRVDGKFKYDSVLYENPADNPQVKAVCAVWGGLVGLATRTAGSKPTSGNEPAVTRQGDTDGLITACGKPNHIVSTELTNNNNTTTTPRTRDEFGECINVLRLRGLTLDSFTSQLMRRCYDEISPPEGETKLEWFTYACQETAGQRAGWKFLEVIIRSVNDSTSLVAHKAERARKNNGQASTNRGKRTTIKPSSNTVRDPYQHTDKTVSRAGLPFGPVAARA